MTAENTITPTGEHCADCARDGLPADHSAADCIRKLLRYKRGGEFILDTQADPEPLWGRGHDVLHAQGEALLVAGGQGTGKTTLIQQYALGRCGFPEYANLLDLPVKQNTWGRVLYLAMDRPSQIARSFHRMVGESWRGQLDAQLTVWVGPPLVDLAKHPRTMLQMAQESDAETVVVDSIKDAAIGLSDDEVGAGYNRARQTLLSEGIEVVEAHHQRKAANGGRTGHAALDDIYGSTWITSGVGSVILLTGSPGDAIVDLHHLKQPANEIGPLRLLHDHEDGQTRVWHTVDLVQLARATTGGITAADVARALFETDKPTPNQREKARRRLDQLAKRGEVVVVVKGDQAANRPTRWGVL